ncbi:hypothetical protein VP01_273g5 [Puccinia sorghi]|uniref:Uncharacterized protein n=1 Tax=Puccinia sorghi TaxID=27349 RepID=A0A0L6V3U3_9BASI|nr:hypothetical protein VP01_273g5 [Puccinia sorghi]
MEETSAPNPGNCIWRSERPQTAASNIASHEEHILLPMSYVKERVENIPEEELKNYLNTIPQFYKHKSTIFTCLDHKNSMEYDYTSIKGTLKRLGKEAHWTCSRLEDISSFKKIAKNIQHLKKFNKLLAQGTKERIYKLKDHGSHIKTMEISDLECKGFARRLREFFQTSVQHDASPRVLNTDVVEIIRQKVWDGQIERLNTILHNINSLKDEERSNYVLVNRMIHKLQRNIFQMVDYMFKQEIISAHAFRKFFGYKNTLEVACLNLYYTPENKEDSGLWYDMYHNKDPISSLNEWHSANYRTLYDVLDERDQRYFSYLSLKTFKLQFEPYTSPFNKLFFENDQLFHTLEGICSVSPEDPSSKAQEVLKNAEPQYSTIIKNVQNLINKFDHAQDERSRINAFFVLDFIQKNYGLEMIDVKTGDKFEERMMLMSASFQLLAELQNINWYMARKSPNGLTLIKDRKFLGEEALMIYKYYHILLSRHQYLFSNTEMKKYCQTSRINRSKNYIEERITEIMSHSNYFIHR